jgi:hypothetical protein
MVSSANLEISTEGAVAATRASAATATAPVGAAEVQAEALVAARRRRARVVLPVAPAIAMEEVRKAVQRARRDEVDRREPEVRRPVGLVVFPAPVGRVEPVASPAMQVARRMAAVPPDGRRDAPPPPISFPISKKAWGSSSRKVDATAPGIRLPTWLERRPPRRRP